MPDQLTGSGSTGRTTSFRRFGPGTILDAPGGIEFDFPAAGLDAANFVAVLQAELRAIASRLVMPEFMLTSDASNANYASTMVAEGPAMRMFARLQADLVNDDLDVMWRVVRAAVDAGGLPAAALNQIAIQVSPPSLAVRDQKQEAEVHQIEYQNGILSPQTWSSRRGLDYEQEQANLARHNQRPQELQGAELAGPGFGLALADPLAEGPDAGVSTALDEAAWDDAKHPRGGNPQNRGEFSSAGGGGGASAAHTPGVVRTVGLTTPAGKHADKATPVGVDGDRSRHPIYLAQKEKPSIKDEGNDISRRLGGADKTPARKLGEPLGVRTWTSTGGTRLRGTLDSVLDDGKSVAIVPADGKKPRAARIDQLSKRDQQLIRGLQALPPNVSLNPEGLKKANQPGWVEDVIADIGRLSELPSGKKVLDGIRDHNNGHAVTIVPRDPGQDNHAEFRPLSDRGSDVTVQYDPHDIKGDIVGGGKGDRTRPPYIALGKELSTAAKALFNTSSINSQREETAAAEFDNGLRDEHNRALPAGEKLVPHRDLP